MAKTQIRLNALTGSIGSGSGQVNDSTAASASPSVSDLGGVLSHLASSIKRINGAASFSEAVAGEFGDLKPSSHATKDIGAGSFATGWASGFSSGRNFTSTTKVIRFSSIGGASVIKSGDLVQIGEYFATANTDAGSNPIFASGFGSSLSATNEGSMSGVTVGSGTTSIVFSSASALTSALGDDVKTGDLLVIGDATFALSSDYSSGDAIAVTHSAGSQSGSGVNGGLTCTLAAGQSGANAGFGVTYGAGSQSSPSGSTSTSAIRQWRKLNVNDIALNGLGRIDLDSDSDTSMRADVDDSITFEVAGSDELNLVATALRPSSDDGLALGDSSHRWSDLFMFDGAVINYGNGGLTVSHSTSAVLGSDLSSAHAGNLVASSISTSLSVLEFGSASQASSFVSAGSIGGGTVVRFDNGSGNVIDITFNSYSSGASLSISSSTQINGSAISKSALESSGTIKVKSADTDQINHSDTLNLNEHDGSSKGLMLGSTLVTSTAAELNIMDGGTAASSTTLADGDRLVVNDDGTMKQVALTDLEVYMEAALDTMGSQFTSASALATVGTLNSGAISSGFGAIDVGSSTIGTTGAVTAGSVLGAASTLNVGASGDADALQMGSASATFANDVDVNIAKTAGLQLGGTAVTSTAAELNKLDGADSNVTAAKLSTLSALSNAEIGYLDGATIGESAASKVAVFDSNGDLEMQDSDKIKFGNGADASIYWDGDSLEIGTESTGTPINIGNATSQVNFGDNVAIAGDLTVTGKTVTNNVEVVSTSTGVQFEGAADDSAEGLLVSTAASSDKTYTLPNVTGHIPMLSVAPTAAITSTPAELSIMDGDTSATSTTVADADRLVLNDGGTMKQVAMTDFETYFEGALDTLANVTTVGALNAGSITADFGNIDNGTSDITTGGLLKLDIDVASAPGSSQAAVGQDGSIVLGAGSDAGLAVYSDDLYIENKTQDKDIIFRANDNGTLTTIAHVDGADGRFQFAAGKLDIAGTAVTATAAELNVLTSSGLAASDMSTLAGLALDGVSGLVTADFTKLAGVDSTAAELNILDGDTSAQSVTIADGDRLVLNDDGTMKQVAMVDFETYFETSLDTLANVTTVGALNAGSITSGFGAIDNGTSNITTGGLLKLDIDVASAPGASQAVVGQAGSIQLGAGGDAGMGVSNDDLFIENATQDKDIAFRVKQGSSFVDVAHIDGANGRFQFGLSKLDINGTAVSTTAAELNLLDGSTSVGSSITIADGDGMIIHDGGTMKTIPMSDVKSYIGGGRSKKTGVVGSAGAVAGAAFTISGLVHDLGADPDVVDVYLNGQLMMSGSGDVSSGDYQIHGKTRGSSLTGVSVGSLSSATFSTSTTSVAFSTSIGSSAAALLPNGSGKVLVMENAAGDVRFEGDINGSLSGSSTSITVNNVRIYNPKTDASVSSLAHSDVASLLAADDMTVDDVSLYFALEEDDVVTVVKM